MAENKLLYPPTQNALQKSLDSTLSSGATAAMTLNNVTGISDRAGVCVVDRIDTSGTAKDAADREYILYTGISGSTLTGLTRGLGGSTDQDHETGAVVEFVPDVNVFEEILAVLAQLADEDDTTTLLVPTLAGDNTMAGDNTFSGTNDFQDDVNIATAKNITYNDTDPSRTIWAGSWKPTTTAGCADSATVEAGTNDIDYDVLDFDKDTDEHAFINWQMPDSWGGGTLLFRVIWTTASGDTDETVDWVLKGRSYANDEAIDQAQGDAVTVSDTWIADGDIHITAWSTAVTLAGTPAGGDWVHLDLMRDISEDDLGGDARMIGVQVKYVQTVFGD